MTLTRYGAHCPTQFDTHLPIDSDDGEGREEWLLVPVSQTRDSGPLDRSNFAIALELLDGESDDVEVYRFGHWGPGWYEIIIVRPGSAAQAVAEEIASRLEDYPVLDETDLSEREHEQEVEDWDFYGASDFRDHVRTADLSDQAGWYYWTCYPGCLPDSEPSGPFYRREDALAKAREDAGIYRCSDCRAWYDDSDDHACEVTP